MKKRQGQSLRRRQLEDEREGLIQKKKGNKDVNLLLKLCY